MKYLFKRTVFAISFLFIITSSGLAQYHYSGIDIPAGTGEVSGIEAFQNNLLNGSFSYNIPLEIPPGVNGMAPKVSLVYNSDNKNGYIGMGWKISGIGLIKRSNKNGVPRYDSSDSFSLALDGISLQDLIYTGSDPSGNTGNYYQSKIHSFLKIFFDSPTDHWIVTDKSGIQYRFGYNPDSRAVRTSGGTKTWHLDRITDTHGNYISISYINDQGATYPSLITYTEGNGLTTFKTVEFTYEDRPDPRIDYSMGDKEVINKRLKEIDVKMAGNLLKSYVLGYTQSADTSQSLLNSVQVFGSDGTSSLPPAIFAYTQLAHNLNSAIPWSNIGNYAGFSRTYTDGYTYVSITMADMNGDGRLDKIIAESSNWQVYLNNGNGFDAPISWSAPVGYAKRSYSSGGYGYFQVDLHDINSDGRADLIIAGPGTWQVYLNNGTGFDVPISWPAPVDHISKSYSFKDGSNIYHTYTYTSLMDMNADHLPDLVVAGSSNWLVYKNNGSGFDSTPITWANPSGINYFDHEYVNTNTSSPLQVYTEVQTLDMNGDGLPDLVVAGNPMRVYFNKGNGFDSASSWQNSAGQGYLGLRIYPKPGTYIGAGYFQKAGLFDVNGDGRPDFVLMGQGGGTRCCFQGAGDVGRAEDAAVNMTVYVNNGISFGNSYVYNFPQPLCITNQSVYSWDTSNNSLRYVNMASFSDINGDLLPDFIDTCCNQNSPVFLNNSNIPDLLSHISNGIGGSLDVSYKPSTTYDNKGSDSKPDLPFIKYVVSSIAQNDGMGNSYATSYSYSGGLYAANDKEFRGFRYIKAVDPSGAYKEFYFHQENELRGRIDYIEEKDSNGSLYLKTTFAYAASQPYSGVYRADLSSKSIFTFDGDSTYKESKIEYAYDAYGNITLTKEHGDTSISGDERYAYSEFAYNPSVYLVNKIFHTQVNASDNSTKVSETWNYYDNATTPNTPPTKGDLTKVVRLLSGGTNPVISNGYDIFGNRTSTTDARGYTSSVIYDTNYYTYPVTETNAKNQTTTKTYDALGRLMSRTDPNNAVVYYQYDALGRITAEIYPYDTQQLPTAVYEYYDDGIAPEYQVVKKRGEPGSTYTFDTYILKDGFGREIQTKMWAEDTAKLINVTTAYDGRGLVITRTNPYPGSVTSSYSSPSGIPFTQYVYDALRRVTGIINPDSTQKTSAYSDWVITNTDENGHRRVLTYDAYGRLIKVQEYDNSALYATTVYTYNTMGNLIQILDNSGNTTNFIYDTLGRKTAVNDPDTGIWTYSYDPNGNLIKQTDARGKIIEFTYDELNRLTRKEYK